MPLKNNSCVVHILAWNTDEQCGQVDDEGNITVRGVGDGTEYTPATPAITPIDDTNLKGVYSVSLSNAENNYNINTIGGISSTPDVIIIPFSWANDINSAAILADTAELQGLISSSKLPVQVKGTDDIDFSATQKTSLNAATPASVQGAVASVTNAVTITSNADITSILADTNELQGLITSSKLPAQVKGMDANVITASALATDAVTEIITAIKAMVIDGAITFEKAQKIMLAVESGKIVITGNTAEYYDQSDAVILTVPITISGAIKAIT
jgi:hypothetical protein